MDKLMLIITALALAGCTDDWQRAEHDAKQFAAKIPGSTGDVSCAHKDTDGDHYVSCTIFINDGSVRTLDCGAERYCFNCAEGCKIVDPAMKFNLPKDKK